MEATRILVTVLMWVSVGYGVASAERPIPAHPSKVEYPALKYELPPAAQFRSVLSNGLVVYIAEDRMLPTFDLTVTLRVGGPPHWPLAMAEVCAGICGLGNGGSVVRAEVQLSIFKHSLIK